MTSTLLMLALLLAAEPDRPADKTPPKRSGIAPSLKPVTAEEEDRFDEIVNRLILSDIGRLRGEAARKATKEFDALPPEAVPALIRGLNRSAKSNYSCPVLLISKKLWKILVSSDDQELLQFARDEIGADVGRSRHAGNLNDLKVKIMLRQNYLARIAPPKPKGLAALTTVALARRANSERGPQLRGILTELAKRTGKEVMPALAFAASSYDRETQKLGRDLLDEHLGKQSASQVVERLDDDSPEIRRSAVRVVGAKHPDFLSRVIDRLTDDDAGVRAEARAVLVKLGKGKDFGPAADDARAEQREAQRKWRDWLKRRTAEAAER
jgi:hypothetical protein